MRLSEKTLELTICNQIATHLGRRMVWFGLTQEQEARAGFDACTQLGGRILILQFKASNTFVRGVRRFHLPHRQLVQLRWRARHTLRRGIYFVLPLVGTTRELAANPDLIPQTWLLNPLDIPRIHHPTTRAGTVRRNGIHYADVTPPIITIHSEPVEAKLHRASDNFERVIQSAPHIREAFPEGLEQFLYFRHLLPRKSVGVIIA
jgi:hypothetical protein